MSDSRKGRNRGSANQCLDGTIDILLKARAEDISSCVGEVRNHYS